VSMSDSEDQTVVYDKDADSATKRAPAITNVEKDLLTNLVRKFSAIVNNKATNKVWKDKKDAAWDAISKEFCSSPNTFPRPGTKLMKIWENLKTRSKYEVNGHENVS
jgi:hypothetical protein